MCKYDFQRVAHRNTFILDVTFTMHVNEGTFSSAHQQQFSENVGSLITGGKRLSSLYALR